MIQTTRASRAACPAGGLLLLAAGALAANPVLGPEERVSTGGADITVPGYSVPCFVPWDGDSLCDLVVGEGGGGVPDGKVRVYPNVGTPSAPAFSGFFYVQSLGSDLVVPASGCLGAFPRVLDWDADGRKDLLVGRADGTLQIFLNVATDADPQFDGGTFVQVGPPGSKATLDVGYRATPAIVDWNNDGREDLVIGALDGKIHVFLNEGSAGAPDFRTEQLAKEGSFDLVVPSGRSSPCVLDWDGDGRKDLLAGNTEGQLLFYANAGTDAAPSFSGSVAVESDGVPIDLAGTPRSRPFVCDWTADGSPDVLIGAADGLVHLYQSEPPGTGVRADPPRTGPDPIRWLSASPNPFGRRTTIAFELARPSAVRAGVVDARGRRVAALADAPLAAGVHRLSWSGLDGAGRPVPAGVYFVRVEAAGTRASARLVRLR